MSEADYIAEQMSSPCGGSEPFALQVIDDSMEPEFKKDCLIIIDPTGIARHGAYVFAIVESGYTFRQLVEEEGKFFIQPLNEAYAHEKQPIEVSAIEGTIVQQSGPKGRRKDRKHYD